MLERTQHPTLDLPMVVSPRDQTVSLVDVLMELEFSQSRSEAKRLIQQGAVKVGGQTITDTNAVLEYRNPVYA